MSKLAIEVRGLRKVFKVGFGGLKTVEALRGLSLSVQPGEIYGFLGPNGAGKSTTIKILTRLISATEGEALVFGEPLASPNARRRIGYLPENPAFYEFLTGRELLDYHGRLLGLPGPEVARTASDLLERVGLGRAGKLQIRRYSKGMVQRLGIAQAILGSPEVVILDEPVSGLDPVGRREMRELILDLKKRGKTVFFSTHIIPDVELVCDRVGIIIAGQMIREGSVSELISAAASASEIVLSGVNLGTVADLFPEWTVREVGATISVLVPPESRVEDALRRVLATGARVVSVQTQRRDLEEIFIQEIATRDAVEPDAQPRATRASGEPR